MSRFTVFPALDIAYGRAVQLVRGVAESEMVFGQPLQEAKRWRDQGAKWLHLVDLDAAFGRGSNADQIGEIVAKSDLQVEVAGGIRDDNSLEKALATGCARVNIGTAAIEKPDWFAEVVKTYSDRVAVAVDVRGDQIVTRGWTQTGTGLWQFIDWLNQIECPRLVVTDTEVDGTLSGTNLELLTQIGLRTTAKLVASGGVASLDDVRKLAGLPQIEGVIIGTALYLGQFSFSQALEAVE